ncbi:MAG: hypothetical protein ABGZ53_30525 [Fuerstiella sp.]|nr:hypothetical protein [Fuerstiella sp.]
MIAHIMKSGCPSMQEAEELLDQKLSEEAWTNGAYTCVVDRSGKLVHLSIKRVDRGPAKDWRHFQQIKNDILGEEVEAIELFPAESRVVDTANQFHLWRKLPGERFEIGFDFKLVQSESDDVSGYQQRPHNDE